MRVLISEYVALPSRIGIIAASVAHAFGLDADAIRRVRVGDFEATTARMTAMAACAEIFAPGSLKEIASYFGASPPIILDALEMTYARADFSDEFDQTWRLLLATAIGLLTHREETEGEACAA
jgi:hypothetical protein